MGIDNLPFDICFNIFILLDDLQDLHCFTSASTSLHQPFQDRRARILSQVFCNEVARRVIYSTTESPHYRLRLCSSLVRYVNAVVAKCQRNVSDAFSLQSAAWDAFSSFKQSYWISSEFGQRLIETCDTLGLTELALRYASDLWRLVITKKTFEHSMVSNVSGTYDMETRKLAEEFAERFYFAGRPKDAIRFVQEYCNSSACFCSHQLLFNIGRYAAALDQPQDIFPFFEDRVRREREAHLRGRYNPSSGGDGLNWTYHFIVLLSQLGKLEEAARLFDNIYDICKQSRANPMVLVGLSRGFGKLLVDRKQIGEALKIRHQVFCVLSHLAENTTSRYRDWANKFVSLLHKADESLTIEEHHWDSTCQEMMLTKDRAVVWGERNAWTWYRSFETWKV